MHVIKGALAHGACRPSLFVTCVGVAEAVRKEGPLVQLHAKGDLVAHLPVGALRYIRDVLLSQSVRIVPAVILHERDVPIGLQDGVEDEKEDLGRARPAFFRTFYGDVVRAHLSVASPWPRHREGDRERSRCGVHMDGIPFRGGGAITEVPKAVGDGPPREVSETHPKRGNPLPRLGHEVGHHELPWFRGPGEPAARERS